MADELKLQVTLIRDAVNASDRNPQPQLTYTLLETMPTGALVTNALMPLNISLVLDRSGSMNGERISNLRQAVTQVINMLEPTDLVSVVLFDDQVEVPIPGQPATNKAQLLSIVNTIDDRGGTQISLGLQKGLEEVMRFYDPNRVNEIVLLTDGFSWGDEPQCVGFAHQAGQSGIRIISLGLGAGQAIPAIPGIASIGSGDDWNQQLIDTIASSSGGISDQIVNATDIPSVFQRVLRSAQASVIRNAELTVRCIAGVTPRQVWQVTPLITNLTPRAVAPTDAQVTLGEIEKNVGKSVVVELVLPPNAPGKTRVGLAEISYDVPAAARIGEKVRAEIVVEYGVESAANPRVANLVEKITAHRLQTRALQDAQAGNIRSATAKLRQAATQLLNMGETELAQAALQEAQNLEQQGQMSSAGTKRLSYGTRKLTQKLEDQPPPPTP